MLKKIFESRKISVYAASKSSGIPYTTLNELVNGKKRIADCNIKTIYALAKFLGMSTDVLYTQLTGQTKIEKAAESWEEKQYKRFRFPVKVESESYDASRIHPLKQRMVKLVSEELKNDERIKRVFVFGNATTIRCNKESGIDFAVELQLNHVTMDVKDEISEKIQEMCLWHANVFWMDSVEEDSKLYYIVGRGLEIR